MKKRKPILFKKIKCTHVFEGKPKAKVPFNYADGKRALYSSSDMALGLYIISDNVIVQ